MDAVSEKRRKGQFYTPTPFADYAHKYMEETFGENWKDEYVVWSCCCGTKNMTRDYYFKELYCSTLENAELQIGARYNKEATCFQMDFLNDGEEKIPNGLIEAMKENKKIIFFINPPYARNTGKNNGIGTSGKVCFTKVREKMNSEKIGACSANLYAQFFYRIMMFKEKYNLTNLHIGLFCPTLFLSGSSYKNFRKKFLKEFSFNKAFQFNAGYFANCASNWGIGFSIWNSGETKDKENFVFDLVDFEGEEIEKVGEKIVYNVDNETTASEWVKGNIKYTQIIPSLSSALKVCSREGIKASENIVGSLCSFSNNVNKNTQNVCMFSGLGNIGNGGTYVIDETNFTKCTALFASRRLVSCNWMNWADEYLAPNEEHPQYQEFINDSLIYSLFESKSNQSSLRQVDYKGKKWDIKNEFFFMSKNEIMDLADECNLDFTYNDAKTSSDRYVYNKLQNITLSKEAKAVLDKAIELTIKSFKYRQIFNEEHPEYQILNWDCGWYQIKGLLKEFMPNECKEFNNLFKNLSDKMRPMVYELNFLK